MPELDPGNRQRTFQAELPTDKAALAKIHKLMEGYAGIPADEVDEHLLAVVSRNLPPSLQMHLARLTPRSHYH
jgi:hypothetical protein